MLIPCTGTSYAVYHDEKYGGFWIVRVDFAYTAFELRLPSSSSQPIYCRYPKVEEAAMIDSNGHWEFFPVIFPFSIGRLLLPFLPFCDSGMISPSRLYLLISRP
jgi:hypothetical protein